MLVDLEMSLAAIFPIGFAIAVGVITETGAKAVVDWQIYDLFIGKPSVPVAANHRHWVLIGMDRPMGDAGAVTAKDVEVDDQTGRLGASGEGTGCKGVSECVPAGCGDLSGHSAAGE